jgi:hypothetical protein
MAKFLSYPVVLNGLRPGVLPVPERQHRSQWR